MARSQGSKWSPEEVVALDVGVKVTKAVHLRRKGGTLVLLGYGLVETPPGERGLPLSPAVLAEHLRVVLKQLKIPCRDVVLTMGHDQAQLSQVDLPQTSVSDLRKMIRLSPKAFLQQDLPDHVFDCYFRPTAKKGDTAAVRRRKSRVLVAAARRRVVNDAIEAARLAGVHLVALVPPAVALANAFRLVRDDSHPDAAVLLDLGATNSTINIVQEGEILLTRTVALGSEKFADVLMPSEEGGEDMSPELMQSKLQKAILTFAREVDASAGFYTSQFERHIDQLFVSGGTARSQLVLQMLESELSYSCESWNLARHLTIEFPERRVRELEYELPQLVIAVGGAAGVLRPDGVRINLLAEEEEAAEERRRDPVRRLGMICALVVAVALGYTGWLGYRWYGLRSSIAGLRQSSVELESTFRKDQSRYLADVRNTAVIEGLRRHAAERVLFANVLDAVQHMPVDGIQFQRFTISRVVEKRLLKPPEGSTEKPKEERWERVVVQVMLRNYGTHQTYEAWRNAVMAHPLFAERLRVNEPVVINAKGEQQADPLQLGRVYTLYVIDCHFKTREVKP